MVNPKHSSVFLCRILPAVVPVLLISVGYVDPGKWVATIEGGARFGYELVPLMLLCNFASILCQYLSARIGIVTGRNLAQICSNEYDNWTCMLLGVQAMFSVVALDLTMMLGVAHGLNLFLRVDISSCVFVTSLGVTLFSLSAAFLENGKANILCVSMAGAIMICYIIGMLSGKPESPLSMSWRLTKLSGDNTLVAMSLLGANIMPHNFYLHSSLIQQHRIPSNISKSFLCRDQLFAIICIFSGICMVNYMLMNSSAKAFNSTGTILLTFQDALSLIEQVFRSPVAPFVFSVVLFFSNQITSLAWNNGGRIVIHDFLQLEIPDWLHRATIRIFATVPALYCACTSGPEGVYQLLILTQVMVALLLPSSVIPLFRIASSRPIMGLYKISISVEFLILIVFIGILGLEIIFITEMIFGNIDWVNNLKWNMGNYTSIPHIVLLITACSSLCLMLWLGSTPLKSASVRFSVREKSYLNYPRYFRETTAETESCCDTPVENFDYYFPVKNVLFDSDLRLTTIAENNDSLSMNCTVNTVKLKSPEPPEKKIVGVDEDLRAVKNDDAKNLSVSSDDPDSLKSLSRISDEVGNGAESLSRLAGLGRAARRQLTVVLDEFWGQLYDFHGQVSHEAKAKKLDVVLGVDSKVTTSTLGMDSSVKESSEYFLSAGGSLSDSSIHRILNDPSYGVERGYNCIQLLNSYACDSSEKRYSSLLSLQHNFSNSSEKRYSSLRKLPSADSYDYGPVTVHGYQIASYLNRTTNKGVHSNNLGLCKKLQKGLNATLVSRFPNPTVSGANILQTKRRALIGVLANMKKHHSLPDISSLYVTYRGLRSISDKSAWKNDYVKYGTSVSRTSYSKGVSKACRYPFSLRTSSNNGSQWSKQSHEHFGVAHKNDVVDIDDTRRRLNSVAQDTIAYTLVNAEYKLLQSLRLCILKLLKLEGSDWLFSRDGVDEDLIGRVAAREMFLYEAENRVGLVSDSHKTGFPIISVPQCGEGCIWKPDLIISFGVWCIHRILELSLLERQPELWEKYTYVLHRLQGIIDPAFLKPRSPMVPCFCLQIPILHQRRPNPPVRNTILHPAPKPGTEKITTSGTLLDLIKDVEVSISCRKHRSSTTAGNIAFPNGKANMASVLKRYKRRLSIKPVTHEVSASCKLSPPGFGL